jgi:tetratricopeptide (TPR) repeat protein
MSEKELLKLAGEIDQALRDGDLLKAGGIAEKLLKKNRSAGLAYKGVIALRASNYDLAEDYLLESFQLNAKQNLALANLIPAYIKKRDFKKAIAFGEQAYAVMPGNASVSINYAAALLQDQSYAKALDVLKPLFNESEPNVSILSGMISCYRGLFLKDEAEKYLEIAERYFGDKHEIMRLKADTLAEVNPEAAYIAFRKALETEPDNVATRWNMSLVQLRLGEFADGWLNYDNGLLPEVGKIGRPIPKLLEGARCIVDLSTIDRNKWTFAVCEQGIGDQVLFLGVLSKFLSEYPKTILIIEKRMRNILSRSFPGVLMYTYGAGPLIAANPDLCNGYVPIGSFQKQYRKTEEDFLNNRNIYLKPDNEKVQNFRDILLKKTGAKRIIGFSWKGGYWERAQKTKTLQIELWDPIFAVEDVIFVSLQYGDVSKEKKYLSEKFTNIRWIDGLDFKKDLDGWLALTCACDEVISVSTALVHFAAAAGRTVHLLLSDRGAPFIWGVQGDKSIAYHDVRIYRKQPDVPNDRFFSAVADKSLRGVS